VPVKVVAVSGIDVVAQPEPGIGEPHPGGRGVSGNDLERASLRLADLLEPERRLAGERAPLQPCLDQVVVVVSGHDYDLAAGHRLAERRKRRRGGLQHLAERSVAELEHVAQQDEPVDIPERGQERLAKAAPPQQVGAAAEAEVQVGDHRRAHDAIVPTVADGTITQAMAPDPRDPGRRPQLPSRLLGLGARGAERVAAATGIDDAVERTTEEGIVRALESPAVERAIIRVLESQAAQDALERTLSSPAVERAAVRVLDSELVDHVWDRLLASDEAQKLVERIAEAPEIRAAIASQGVGLLDDIGRQIRRVAGRLDDGLERVVRRLIGRPRTAPTNHVGLITRGVAAALDAVVLNGIFLAATALLGIIFSALGDPDGVSTVGLVAGFGAWLFFGSAYLVVFWALAGQTPGMRVLSIRLEDYDGSRRLGSRRARRRLAGTLLSLIPFGLGFLGIVTRDDRRGFPDRHARTDVVPVDPLGARPPPRAAAD
jgi:uncharacterized RDD family membrane protein YckC